MYLKGVPYGLDLPHHYRLAQGFFESIKGGDFYPSWLSFTNGGYGDPSVRFYPPAQYYILSFFRLLTGDWYLASLTTLSLLWVLACTVASLTAPPGQVAAPPAPVIAPPDAPEVVAMIAASREHCHEVQMPCFVKLTRLRMLFNRIGFVADAICAGRTICFLEIAKSGALLPNSFQLRITNEFRLSV